MNNQGNSHLHMLRNVKNTISEAIGLSQQIIYTFWDVPCAFYPMALGTNNQLENMVYVVYDRCLVDGYIPPTYNLTLDELIRLPAYNFNPVFMLEYMRDVKRSDENVSFPEITVRLHGFSSLTAIHPNCHAFIS